MRTGLLLTIALVVGFPTSLAQSQSFQTSDPTAQAPSTLAPTPSVAVPLEVKQSGDGVSDSETTAAESSLQETGTSFVGDDSEEAACICPESSGWRVPAYVIVGKQSSTRESVLR